MLQILHFKPLGIALQTKLGWIFPEIYLADYKFDKRLYLFAFTYL